MIFDGYIPRPIWIYMFQVRFLLFILIRLFTSALSSFFSAPFFCFHHVARDASPRIYTVYIGPKILVSLSTPKIIFSPTPWFANYYFSCTIFTFIFFHFVCIFTLTSMFRLTSIFPLSFLFPHFLSYIFSLSCSACHIFPLEMIQPHSSGGSLFPNTSSPQRGGEIYRIVGNPSYVVTGT